MLGITHFPRSTATPDRHTVLRAQGIPDEASVPKRVAALIDDGFEIYSSTVDATGIRSEISIEEFDAVYRGEGRNASRTPLEGIFPDAHGLALFAVTVGEAVCSEIRRLFKTGDPALGYTLDTIASAGAEGLADAMARDYQDTVSRSNPNASDVRVLPYSPGYCGWHVSGQAKLFELLQPERIGISLNASCSDGTSEVGLRRVGGCRQRDPRLRYRVRLLHRLRRPGMPGADPIGSFRHPWRSMMDVLQEIASSLRNGDDQRTALLTQQAIDDGIPAEEILNNGLMAGMKVVGALFRDHEIFLPEVLLAARAMNRGVDLLKPLLAGGDVPTIGKVVIGTAKGDLHDIGKNLVGIMLKGAGFEVIDLGNDVTAERFVDAAVESGAKVIGISALLTTTMSSMKGVVDLVRERGLGGEIHTIVGGAPVSKEFAAEIGADAYGYDAANAVEQVKALTGV